MTRSFFISYSFNDSEAAEMFADRLGARGCLVWFAQSNMRAGMPISHQLDRGLYEADVLLVLISKSSAGSDWVKREIAEFHAIQQHPKRRLCPVRLDEQTMEAFELADPAVRDWLRAHYAPNFTAWRDPVSFSANFDELAREFDAIASPINIHLAGRNFPAGSFRTIGREGELMAAPDLPETLRQRAEAAAVGQPDRAGIGAEAVESWSRARRALRQERSTRNRDVEASRARLLISFLANNRADFSGLYVANLARKEIEAAPGPTVAPELLKAIDLYSEKTAHTAASAGTETERKRWWPFRRRKQ
jgi:TIR domain